MDLGAGLASLAFWGFVAAIIVAGVWDGAKKREAQHETLRRMIESGKAVDDALMQRLMLGEPRRPDRDLKIAAIILSAIAPGLGVFALVLGAERALMPLLGAATLVAFIAGGLWAASAYARRTQDEDDAHARRSPDAS
jgi:hypothetical protein